MSEKINYENVSIKKEVEDLSETVFTKSVFNVEFNNSKELAPKKRTISKPKKRNKKKKEAKKINNCSDCSSDTIILDDLDEELSSYTSNFANKLPNILCKEEELVPELGKLLISSGMLNEDGEESFKVSSKITNSKDQSNKVPLIKQEPEEFSEPASKKRKLVTVKKPKKCAPRKRTTRTSAKNKKGDSAVLNKTDVFEDDVVMFVKKELCEPSCSKDSSLKHSKSDTVECNITASNIAPKDTSAFINMWFELDRLSQPIFSNENTFEIDSDKVSETSKKCSNSSLCRLGKNLENIADSILPNSILQAKTVTKILPEPDVQNSNLGFQSGTLNLPNLNALEIKKEKENSLDKNTSVETNMSNNMHPQLLDKDICNDSTVVMPNISGSCTNTCVQKYSSISNAHSLRNSQNSVIDSEKIIDYSNIVIKKEPEDLTEYVKKLDKNLLNFDCNTVLNNQKIISRRNDQLQFCTNTEKTHDSAISVGIPNVVSNSQTFDNSMHSSQSNNFEPNNVFVRKIKEEPKEAEPNSTITENSSSAVKSHSQNELDSVKFSSKKDNMKTFLVNETDRENTLKEALPLHSSHDISNGSFASPNLNLNTLLLNESPQTNTWNQEMHLLKSSSNCRANINKNFNSTPFSNINNPVHASDDSGYTQPKPFETSFNSFLNVVIKTEPTETVEKSAYSENEHSVGSLQSLVQLEYETTASKRNSTTYPSDKSDNDGKHKNESYPLTKEEIDCYYKLAAMNPFISLLSKYNLAAGECPSALPEMNSTDGFDVTCHPHSLNLVSSPLNLVSNPLNLLSTQIFQDDQIMEGTSFESGANEINNIPGHNSSMPNVGENTQKIIENDSQKLMEGNTQKIIEDNTQKEMSNDVSFDSSSNLRMLLENLKANILRLSEPRMSVKDIQDFTYQDYHEAFDECTSSWREMNKNSQFTKSSFTSITDNSISIEKKISLIHANENVLGSSSKNITISKDKKLTGNYQNSPSSGSQNVLIDISHRSRETLNNISHTLATVNKSSHNLLIEPLESSDNPYFENQLNNLSLKSIEFQHQLPTSDSVATQKHYLLSKTDQALFVECSHQPSNLFSSQYGSTLLTQNLENTSESFREKSSLSTLLPLLTSQNEASCCFKKNKEIQVSMIHQNFSAQSSKREGSFNFMKEMTVIPNTVLDKVDVPLIDLLKIIQTANNLPTVDPVASSNLKEVHDYDHICLPQNFFQDNSSYDQDCLYITKQLSRSNYYKDYQPLLKIPTVRDYGHKSAEDLNFSNLHVALKETDNTTNKVSNDVCSSELTSTSSNNLGNEIGNSNSESYITSTWDVQDLGVFMNNLEEKGSNDKKENEQHIPQYKSRWEKKYQNSSSQTKLRGNYLPPTLKSTKGKLPPKKDKQINKSNKKLKSSSKNKSKDNESNLFQPDKITKSKVTFGDTEKNSEPSSSNRVYGRITNRGSFLTHSSVNQPPKSKALVGKKSIDKKKNCFKTPDEFHLMVSSKNIETALSPEPAFSPDISAAVLPNISPKEICLPTNFSLIPNFNDGKKISQIAKRSLLPTPKIGIHHQIMKNEFKLDERRNSNLNRNYSLGDLNMEISSPVQSSPSLTGSPIYLKMDSSILNSPVTGQFSAAHSALNLPNRSNHHRLPLSRHSKCVCLPPRYLKASVGNAIFDTVNVLLLILEWNVDWLEQQQKRNVPPPISNSVRKVINVYENIEDYYNTYFPLMLLETWQRMYMSWTHLNQAYLYFCQVTSYTVETHSIKVECQTFFKNSDAESRNFPDEGDIIIIKFGIKEKGGIKILGFVTKVKVETFDAVTDSQNLCYRTLKLPCTENLQKLFLTFIGAYTSGDFDLNQLIRIQVLCGVKSTLKQNDAMLFLKNSPLYKNILNPLTDGLRTVTVVSRCTDPLKVKESVSECVRDIVKGILSPHPLPLLTIAKSLPSSDRLLVLPPLIEKMKHFYKTKVLLCTRTTKALTDIGFNLCTGSIKFVIMGKRADIHPKLRKYLIDKLAVKRLTKENSSTNEDSKGELLENTKMDVLKNCDVILSPIRNCQNNLITKAWVDGDSIAQMCCIIDEANLCTEVEILIPLSYGMSKLILIGDPDVPAKVCSNAAANNGYNRSLFHRAFALDLASE